MSSTPQQTAFESISISTIKYYCETKENTYVIEFDYIDPVKRSFKASFWEYQSGFVILFAGFGDWQPNLVKLNEILNVYLENKKAKTKYNYSFETLEKIDSIHSFIR